LRTAVLKLCNKKHHVASTELHRRPIYSFKLLIFIWTLHYLHTDIAYYTIDACSITHFLFLVGSGSGNGNIFSSFKSISKAVEICQASFNSIIRIWTREAGRGLLWIPREASCEYWCISGGDNGRIISFIQTKIAKPPVSKTTTSPATSEASKFLACAGKFRDPWWRWTSFNRHKSSNP